MAFAIVETAAVALFCGLDVAGFVADSRVSPGCLLSAGRESVVEYEPIGAVTERFWGVTASGAGEPYEGEGEP